ncbi:MAG: GyrI-like domain-containing protein [Pseudonocardiaceae bacterium]
MTNEPQIEQRPAQPYIGIRETVAKDGFPAAVDKGFPELFSRLEEQGLSLAGAPFIRYHLTSGTEFEIELGAPADAVVPDEGRIRSGSLPAGRYVTLRHLGPFGELPAAHEALQQWAREHGVTLDSWDTDRGTGWLGCAEHYLVDPSAEPDPAKWEVELAYLTEEH